MNALNSFDIINIDSEAWPGAQTISNTGQECFSVLICQQRQSSKLLTGRVLQIPPSGLPGGPVAKTPCSKCRGPGFDPWSGNLSSHATTKDPTGQSKD